MINRICPLYGKLGMLMVASTCCHAIIQTQPPFIVLSEQNQQAKLIVSNTDSHRGYIEMFAKEIHCKNDSCSSYKEIDTENAKKIQFSTPKFILDPGQKRNIIVFVEGDYPNKLREFAVGAYDHAQEAEQITKTKQGKSTFTIKYRTEHSMKLQTLPAGTSIGIPEIILNDNTVIVKNPQSAPLNITVKDSCIKDDCKPKHIVSQSTLLGNSKATVDLKSNYRTVIKYFNPYQQNYEELYNTDKGITKLKHTNKYSSSTTANNLLEKTSETFNKNDSNINQ